MSVKEWLIQWFENNAGVNRNELEMHIEDNFFDIGYLDSFAFISLIGDIEDYYKVSFQNDQFEDRTFSTVSGMAKIIEEIMKDAD